MSRCVIFGAGKIARGFIGHLLFLSGVPFAFCEKSGELARLLNERGRYEVNVLGAPAKNSVVAGYRAFQSDDAAALAREMADVETVFTAVGGKNLAALAPTLAAALTLAGHPVNVVTCENWKRPAALLREEISRLAPGLEAGFAESVVMRSAIEASPEQLARDPLVVNVQNYWRLPIDASGLIRPLPNVPGMEATENFAGFLERKFYTYNAANATVSYLGALLGHALISDAASDARVARVLEKVYRETGLALSQKHGVPLEEQMAFAATSRDKLRDAVIVDTVERNARDPLRKLGPDDRLVGSARLAESWGVAPDGLATAIAAALHYCSPGDPSSDELMRLMRANGASAVLRDICGISAGEPLAVEILEKERELKRLGWIREEEICE